MKEIIDQYSATLIAVVVALALIAIYMGTSGNISAFSGVGKTLDNTFSLVKEKKNNRSFNGNMTRKNPKIKFKVNKNVYAKENININDLFSAVDTNGNNLKIEVLCIKNSHNQNVENSNLIYHEKIINFEESGVYTFYLKTIDSHRKVTKSKIKIPVKKEKNPINIYQRRYG